MIMRVTYPHLPRLLKVARTVGGMKPRVNVVWHKMSDLRVHDHEPLARAHLETRASAEPCSSSNALATGVIDIDLSWGKTVRFLGGMNILWLNLLQFALCGWGVVSVEAYFYGGRYCISPPKFDFIVAQCGNTMVCLFWRNIDRVYRVFPSQNPVFPAFCIFFFRPQACQLYIYMCWRSSGSAAREWVAFEKREQCVVAFGWRVLRT